MAEAGTTRGRWNGQMVQQICHSAKAQWHKAAVPGPRKPQSGTNIANRLGQN